MGDADPPASLEISSFITDQTQEYKIENEDDETHNHSTTQTYLR